MKFKIHFTIGDYEDSFTIEGDNVEEIREECRVQESNRGLDADKNNMWSEELK